MPTNRVEPPAPAPDLSDVLMVSLVRGDQRFVVLYRPDQARSAVLAVYRWVHHAGIEFDLYDFARLAERIRQGVGD